VTEPHRQRTQGLMAHPRESAFNRALFRLPHILWRMGLGPLLGRRMLVLTTRGRRSGLPRYTLLEYGEVHGVYYLLSGWGDRADWVRNLQADPQATIQTHAGTFDACARRVLDMDEFRRQMAFILAHGGDAYFRPWLRSLDIEYDLDDLIAKRDRVHLIALEPTGGAPVLPTYRADLLWLWPVLALAFVLAGRLLQRPRC